MADNDKFSFKRFSIISTRHKTRRRNWSRSDTTCRSAVLLGRHRVRKERTTRRAEQSGEGRSTRIEKYLNHTVDLEELPIPLVRFPGLKQTIPDKEVICNGWTEAISEIAPSDLAAVVPEKKDVPYYIGGTLKDAEFVG